MLNQAQLAGSLAVSGQTVARCIDLLCDLMLVRRLPAWHGNVGKRLVRSSAPSVSKGFHLAAADIAATRKLLIAPVATSFNMRDGIEVMNPLAAARLLAEQ